MLLKTILVLSRILAITWSFEDQMYNESTVIGTLPNEEKPVVNVYDSTSRIGRLWDLTGLDSQSLICNATGIPSPKLSFGMLHGEKYIPLPEQLLQSVDVTLMSDTNELHINFKEITQLHNPKDYACIANNSAGSDVHTFRSIEMKLQLVMVEPINTYDPIRLGMQQTFIYLRTGDPFKFQCLGHFPGRNITNTTEVRIYEHADRAKAGSLLHNAPINCYNEGFYLDPLHKIDKEYRARQLYLIQSTLVVTTYGRILTVVPHNGYCKLGENITFEIVFNYGESQKPNGTTILWKKESLSTDPAEIGDQPSITIDCEKANDGKYEVSVHQMPVTNFAYFMYRESFSLTVDTENDDLSLLYV